MYPRVSYILSDLFNAEIGAPFDKIYTYGVALILALVTMTLLVISDIKRKENEGILKPIKTSNRGVNLNPFLFIVDKLVAFILGYKVWYILSNEAFSFEGLLSWKGSFVGGFAGLGLGIALSFIKQEKQRSSPNIQRPILPHQKIINILLVSGHYWAYRGESHGFN